MAANHAQREYLAQQSAASVNDLDSPEKKLFFANLHDVPDPEPDTTEPEMNEAQRMFMLGRSADDLDNFQREIFNKMGAFQIALRGDVIAEPSSGRATGGPPRLCPKKLADANLPPSRRLEIAHHFDVVEKAYRESMSGIEPRLRETRWDIETAKHHVAAYLI